MTRIVAGRARGRRLKVPATGTRPTSDRAREALFSALDSQLGGFAGLHVVDLYAGSGALGLESLSRGAEHSDLVESGKEQLVVLRQNVDAVGLPGAVVHAVTVERWVRERDASATPVDLVFADPPYDVTDDQLAVLLARLAARGGLAPDAVVVVERPSRGGEFRWPQGFTALRDRRYGEATLWFGRFDSVTAC